MNYFKIIVYVILDSTSALIGYYQSIFNDFEFSLFINYWMQLFWVADWTKTCLAAIFEDMIKNKILLSTNA